MTLCLQASCGKPHYSEKKKASLKREAQSVKKPKIKRGAIAPHKGFGDEVPEE